MADERKEPTLSSGALNEPAKRSSQNPRQTQVPSEQAARPQQNRPAPKAKRPPNARPQGRSAAPAKASSSGRLMLSLAFIVSFVALAAALYSVQQLLAAGATIEQQQNRIAELENKLALAGDSSSQSITSLAANLVTMGNDVKLSLSEIDKLWATRNVNKKAIGVNAEKVADVESQVDETNKVVDERVKATEKKLANLGNATQQQIKQIRGETKTQSQETAIQLSSFDEKLNQQNQQFSNLSAELTELKQAAQSANTLAKSIEDQQQEQELLLQSVRERLQRQTGSQEASGAETAQQLSATLSQLDAVSKQVETNRESLVSFEAFRRAVNRDLLLLKQGSN